MSEADRVYQQGYDRGFQLSLKQIRELKEELKVARRHIRNLNKQKNWNQNDRLYR